MHSAKPQAWLVPVCLGPYAAALSRISSHLVQLCDLLLQCNWHQHTIQDQTLVAYQQLDVTNRHFLLLQKSPPASISPDAPRPASTSPRQQAPVPAPSGQHSSMWSAPPPAVRTPTGLYAMLTPGGTGQSGALYDLLKSADNSPR